MRRLAKSPNATDSCGKSGYDNGMPVFAPKERELLLCFVRTITAVVLRSAVHDFDATELAPKRG
jgi:hypothetical protein